MRFTRAVGLLMLVACEKSGVKYLGPLDDGTINLFDSAPTTPINSCDEQELLGSCTAFTGLAWDVSTFTCSGTTVPACSTAAIGSCTVNPGEPLEYVVWYYVGDFFTAADAPTLEADCLSSFNLWQ